MGAPKLADVVATDDLLQLTFSDCDEVTVGEVVGKWMVREGYRLEVGHPLEATYGIGNDVMRILFGAFVKRFKFQVSIGQAGNVVDVRMTKAMTGWSGGVIGLMKMKSEFKRLSAALEKYARE